MTEPAATAPKKDHGPPGPRGGHRNRAANQKKHAGRMAGVRRREMSQEIASLREALEITETQTVDEWEAALPEDVRDRMAARAIFTAWGSYRHGLRLLGIEHVGLSRDAQRAIGKRVFGKPAVAKELDADFGDVSANRKAILARCVQTARFGTDELSLRATMTLAKIEGWVTGPEVQVNVDRRTVNLYNLVDQGDGRAGHGDEQESARALLGGDPMTILSHDPGEPERIETDSGDIRIDRAIASGAPASRLEDL